MKKFILFDENDSELEKSETTAFQKKILKRNPDLSGRRLIRYDIKEETGKWIYDIELEGKLISAGGEAIVWKEIFDDRDVAVRVQAFDPYLFTKSEETTFKIFLATDYREKNNTIPRHKNVITNFANIEIYDKDDVYKEDCVGWITIMEKCDNDLRTLLRSGKLNLEERKKIAIGVRQGNQHLKRIDIQHYDLKPENILIKNGEAKIIDFGVVMNASGKKSFREMGYTRKGSKYKYFYSLFSGSPAFSQVPQLTSGHGDVITTIFVFIFCEWKTAWTLLYRPVEEEEEKRKFDLMIKQNNADCILRQDPIEEEMNAITRIISLKDSNPYFCLDDPNLTKSCKMSSLKQQMTRVHNFSFQNVTRNVVDQKSSDLSVPITVSSLIRYSIKADMGFLDNYNNHSFENIFTTLVMIVYPRSLAGMNLGSDDQEKQYQGSEIELLLKRIKFPTYLMISGWEIIRKMGYPVVPESFFDYQKETLTRTFFFTRPLSVTGAYLLPDDSIIFHQMVLDRVENDEYILQNTMLSMDAPVIRIPVDRPYYKPVNTVRYNDGMIKKIIDDDGVNEQIGNMETAEWYLLPDAFSVRLSPIF